MFCCFFIDNRGVKRCTFIFGWIFCFSCVTESILMSETLRKMISLGISRKSISNNFLAWLWVKLCNLDVFSQGKKLGGIGAPKIWSCSPQVDKTTPNDYPKIPPWNWNMYLHVHNWVVVSNIFYFHPYLGRRSNRPRLRGSWGVFLHVQREPNAFPGAVVAFLSLLQTTRGSPDSAPALRGAWAEEVFVKPEMHGAKKVRTKRWRAIWHCSAQAELTVRLLHDSQNKVEIAAYQQGMTHSAEFPTLDRVPAWGTMTRESRKP